MGHHDNPMWEPSFIGHFTDEYWAAGDECFSVDGVFWQDAGGVHFQDADVRPRTFSPDDEHPPSGTTGNALVGEQLKAFLKQNQDALLEAMNNNPEHTTGE